MEKVINTTEEPKIFEDVVLIRRVRDLCDYLLLCDYRIKTCNPKMVNEWKRRYNENKIKLAKVVSK